MAGSTNKAAVPEAKGALDRFKYEVASEIGVPLSDGYNGDLTSRQNGSVGGYMVKNICPVRTKTVSRIKCSGYSNVTVITYHYSLSL